MMRTFDFHQPQNLSDALNILERIPDTRIVAGGTDLMVMMKDLLLSPGNLVSLAGLKDLVGIHEHSDEWIVGPMTPLWRLEHSETFCRTYPALHQAIINLSAPPVRNQATLGGNICLDTKCIYFNQSHVWERNLPRCLKAYGDVCFIAPAGKRCMGALVAETAGPLWIYGAELTLTSRYGTRKIPLREFFTGDGLNPHNLARGEILTAVHLPLPPPRSGSAYRRFAYRKALEFSQFNLSTTMTLDNRGRIASARLVVGAISPSPVELQESLYSIIDHVPSETLWTEAAKKAPREAAHMTHSPRLSPYLQEVLFVYTERLFKEVFRRAQSNYE